MDSTALTLCMDNNLPIIVFNVQSPGEIERIILGEQTGTLVCQERGDPVPWEKRQCED